MADTFAIPEYDGFDASFFDPEDDVFGLEEQGLTPPGNASVNPTTLAFALLLLSTYTAPPPWNGTASAGTSGSNPFSGANGAQTAASFSLETWQRVTATTSISPTWPGRASTGISGTESWSNSGGLNPPGAGGGINGFTTLYFDGSFGENLQAAHSASTYIANTSSSGWVLIKPISIINDTVFPQNNDLIVGDAGQYYGVSLSATAILGGPAASFFFTTAGITFHVDCTVVVGSWNLIQWRHTGTSIEIRCCLPNQLPGAWQTVSNDGLGHNVGNLDAGYAAQTLFAGQNPGFLGVVADFELADLAINNAAFTHAQFDSIAVDVELYFALFFTIFPGPTTGPSLNGFTSANFDGVFRAAKYEGGSLADLIGPCDRPFYVTVMFKARTAVTDTPGARYSNDWLFGDLNQNIYLTFSSAGVSAGIYDQGLGMWVDTGALACATGGWHLVQMWHDGQFLYLQLDNGTPIFVPVSLDWMAINVSSMTACIGGNNAASFFDGEMHFVGAQNGGYPNAYQQYGMGIYLQNRYGVSFGFVSFTSYTRNVAESIAAPTDGKSRVANYVRAVADAVTKPADAVSRPATFVRAIAESVGAPTDGKARVFGATRSVAEAIAAATDAVTRAATYARVPTENVAAPTDVPSRRVVFVRAIGESLAAPTDAPARVVGHVINVAESIAAPTDATSRAAAFVRALAESIAAPTDLVSRSAARFRTVGESVGAPVDAVARVPSYSRSIAEAFAAPTDAVTHAFGVSRAVAESVAAPTDAVSFGRGAARSVGESVGAPTDGLTRAWASARAISESVVAMSDSIQRAATYVRALGEGVAAPSDAVSFSKNSGATSYTRNIGETIAAVADAVARTTAFVRAVSEAVTKPTDAATRAAGFQRALFEGVGAPADAVLRSDSATRAPADAVTKPTDAVSRFVAFSRAVAEAVTKPADAIAKLVGLSRSPSESVAAPTDAVSRTDGFVRTVVELVFVSDAVGRQYATTRQASENVARPADAVARVRGAARFVVETLAAPTDAVAHANGFDRSIVEVVALCFDTVSAHIVKVPLPARAGGGGGILGRRVVLASSRPGAIRAPSSSLEGRTESPSTRQPGVPSPGPRKR